ncbi:MAG: TonB family protein [Spirochaetaceae bacterium]|nr:TonB family protein [Spirochaetaceae bacterium]
MNTHRAQVAPLATAALCFAFGAATAQAPASAVDRAPSGLRASLAARDYPSPDAPRGRPEPGVTDQDLDLVFVLDTTVSMKASLGNLKAAVSAVADAAAGLEPAPALRLGLVLFRDPGDDYQIRARPLTPDPEAFGASLAMAEAAGGGDIPEDIGAALLAALRGMAWRPGSLRLVFLATDAPPRAPLSAAGSSCAAALELARSLGVGLYTVEAEGTPPAGGAALEALASGTGAARLVLGAGRTAGTRFDGAAPNLVRGPLESLVVDLVAAELAAARRTADAERRSGALRLLADVEARLLERLVFPEAARRRGVEGTSRLLLRVDAAGNLVSVKLVGASGSALLDGAALDLARASFPIANPARRETELEIGVRYRLAPAPGGK